MLGRLGNLVFSSFLFGAAVADLPPAPPSPGVPPVKPDAAPPPRPDAAQIPPPPDGGVPDAALIPEAGAALDAGTLDAIPLSARGPKPNRLLHR